MRRPRILTIGIVCTLVLSACASSSHTPATSGSTTPATRPATSTTNPATSAAPSTAAHPARPSSNAGPRKTVKAVGVLFLSHASSDHVCTAAVANSVSGNVIVTAAHCLIGTGQGYEFVPDYDNGSEPHGRWIVQRSYALPGWLSARDDHDDFAFLQVTPAPDNTPENRQPVQRVVGGFDLGTAPTSGSAVTLAGYVMGHGDEPLICTARVYATREYPTVDCPGYAGGTSGSPWLSHYDPSTGRGTLTALIGGLEEGGCKNDTSYSSPFGAATRTLLTRADAGGIGDEFPMAAMSTC